MNARKIAQEIIALRALIIDGHIARLSDRNDLEYWAEFTQRADRLPRSIQTRNGLTLRVALPAERIIRREGILAQTTKQRTK